MEFVNIEPLEKAKDIIADIISKQIEAGNMSNRYKENPKALTDTVNYCAMIASLMIGHVLNKGYFPQLKDEHTEHIATLNIVAVVLNVVYPYVMDSKFILTQQKQIRHELEEYEADNCLLYLSDDNNTYQQVLNYLAETFINVI